jgi:hypothetical protein
MFLLSAFVIGFFLDVTAAQLFMLALAKEIFEIVGMEKEDKWTKVITIGLSFTVIITFAITPICHTLPILFMGSIPPSRRRYHWLSYMLNAVPSDHHLLVMYFFMKLIIKPDIEQAENIDFTRIEAARPRQNGARRSRRALSHRASRYLLGAPGYLSVSGSAEHLRWMNMICGVLPAARLIVIMALCASKGGRCDIPAGREKNELDRCLLLAALC